MPDGARPEQPALCTCHRPGTQLSAQKQALPAVLEQQLNVTDAAAALQTNQVPRGRRKAGSGWWRVGASIGDAQTSLGDSS